MKKEYYIYLFIFVALIPIMLFRDFTPSNELRYLSIADEALRNGQFFAFTNHGIPYADKPPLYLWIVMLGKVLFGSHQMWFLSLFSILPAFGCTILMNQWTKEELQPSEQELATWLLLSSALFMGTAVVLRMDMLMCLFILLALHSFYHMIKDEHYLRSKRALLFPLYMFLGLFTKGPLGVLIPLVSAYVFLAVTGRIKKAAHFTGGWKTWVILLGGCIIWFTMVYIDGGSDYLDNLLFHQTFGRAVNAFHHKQPIYYYLYSVWYDMLPWSLLSIGIIITAIYRHWLQTDLEKLFLTVICCTFIMLSLISSKLDVYLIPAYPFIIYLTVIYLRRIRYNGWTCIALVIPALAFITALPLFYLIVQKPDNNFLQHGCFYGATAILTCAGLYAIFTLLYHHNIERSSQTMAAGIFLALFIGGWGLPSINDRIGYRKLCTKAVDVAKAQHLSQFYTWRMYRSENMDVFLHTDINILPKEKPVPENLSHCILITPTKEADNIRYKKTQFVIGENSVIVL